MIISKKNLLLGIGLLSLNLSPVFSMDEKLMDEKPAFSGFISKKQRYTSDLSGSYRTSGVATSADYDLMERKFKEDFLKKGYKGQYWTQENVDKWEIPDSVREQMNQAAAIPYQIAEKKEYFKQLNGIIKGLNLKRPKPTDISDLSKSYHTSGIPTPADYELMGVKFEEDFFGEFWTQEKVDEWEISDESRERSNNILNYCTILKKTPAEFYDYWSSLQNSQESGQ